MRCIVATCVALVWFVSGCTQADKTADGERLFRLLHPDETGIDFVNQLTYSEDLNTYTFKNFYNGGGVGIADVNNDGLPEVLLTGNMVSNKLFLNKGNLKFEDITLSSGLESSGSWSTGVSIADINADGFLDIYICKSGPPAEGKRHNQLFINNGDLTFTEQSAAYGLDFVGLSTHAAFFDFDKDSDLDCYLLNNSIRSIGAYDLRKDQREIPDPEGGNKLLRNDGGKFVDVSRAAGIYTSMIGFGLGVTIGDVNKDGWSDIYVSNDFFEKDYLYINQRDGTFREALEEMMREISLGSMGADMADINNDALPEIFVTEMLPADDARLKTTAQFENWDKYATAVSQGYYHQFGRNVLQLNNGDGTFSEIGRLAGVEATDWSWGALIFDMNNDGHKDIFVANGIFKDLLDQDYINFVSNRKMVRSILQREGAVIRQLIDSIPSNRVANFAFENSGNLTFVNRAADWGFGEPSHSNGSAYGDLDNDGDLDLVLNNVNMPAFVYENRSDTLGSAPNFLSVVLRGKDNNTFAVGTKLTVKAGGRTFYQEHSPMRGFMSTVDYKIHFGLGDIARIDSLIVEWPDDRVTIETGIAVNRTVELEQREAKARNRKAPSRPADAIFSYAQPGGAAFVHRENTFVDFDRDRLLFNMSSNEGPCLCTGDINNDGLDDFYVGGAKDQPGSLFMQQPDGNFATSNQAVFDADSDAEDTDCLFFDADGDGYEDLYVASGGSEFSAFSTALADRLYFNRQGKNLAKSEQMLPVASRFESSSSVAATDFDGDGDQDLFVGVRLRSGQYGLPADGYVLTNDGRGNFSNATSRIAPDLLNIGMITDATWADLNTDSWKDLILVGEWMPVTVLMNNRGTSLIRVDSAFGESHGWYHAVACADLNNDGLTDIVTGNHGLNSRFSATAREPVQLYISDYDGNGSLEHITTRYTDGESLPLVLRQDLVMQIPSLKKKYLHFEAYKDQTIGDIFTDDQLAKAVMLKASDFETAVWLNNGDRSFSKKSLPLEAQFSPVYALLAKDIDDDNNCDILLGGNLYRAKPETGIYDASYGLVLKGNGEGEFAVVPAMQSGVSIKGEIRRFATVRGRSRMLVVARNNAGLLFLKY